LGAASTIDVGKLPNVALIDTSVLIPALREHSKPGRFGC
jgi:hypothetical protein